jgi:hypothetical protein
VREIPKVEIDNMPSEIIDQKQNKAEDSKRSKQQKKPNEEILN